MGFKYICHVCGKEFVIGDETLGWPMPHYSVSVARSVEGWATIWLPIASEPKSRSRSLEAVPVTGELVCSPACAEQALARINREQLSLLFKETVCKPETKLMSAIFGTRYNDDDLLQSSGGVSLRDTLVALVDEISQRYRYNEARFSERVKEIITLRFGLEDGRSHTLEEIGKGFGVTRERIRQHESLALRCLRHPRRANRLKPFIKKQEGG